MKYPVGHRQLTLQLGEQSAVHLGCLWFFAADVWLYLRVYSSR